MIYLDWAATTPPDPEIIAIMGESARKHFGNPSSLHSDGQKAKTALADARLRCAGILGCNPEQLAFTSGGTESNAMAILSHLNDLEPGAVLVSNIEHPSVMESVRLLGSHGWKITYLQTDPQGIVHPEKLKALLMKWPSIKLVAIMTVSNEIGSIQPIQDLAKTIRCIEKDRNRPIHFHSDMVQTVGKIPVNLEQLGVDTASFGAHKFCGPRGVGLFYHRKLQFNALFRGGGQEFNIRPGTENVAGAVGIALALENYANPSREVQENGTWLLSRLAEIQGAHILPIGRMAHNNKYVPNIIAVAFPPIPGEVLARVLSENGYAVSSGSACRANRRGKPQNITSTPNLSREVAHSMIRISLGVGTARADLESFIQTLKESVTILGLANGSCSD